MPEPRESTGRPRADDPTRTKALTLYLCGWPVGRIAAALGLSYSALHRHLRAAGAGAPPKTRRRQAC